MTIFAREVLEARQLWGTDQGGYEAAIKAEIAKRWPTLVERKPGIVLNDLSTTDRIIVLHNIMEARKEVLRMGAVKGLSVPLTERLLQASAAIGRHESLEAIYLYAEGERCDNGQREKLCHLLGPAEERGKAEVRRYGTIALVPMDHLCVTKATAMRLEVVAAEQERSPEEIAERPFPTVAPVKYSRVPAHMHRRRATRDNRGQFTGNVQCF